MAFYEMNTVANNPGGRELTLTVNTTATGPQDVYFIPPASETGVGIIITALSTAVVKVQATTDTLARITGGTALWYDLPAPFTGVTTGTVAGGGVLHAISALRVNVTTALAGNQATIAIRTNATRN
jgi:hypothetical protein